MGTSICYNTSMKLLSPVGNMDSLRAAVWNGADEVYLGVNDFNARNNIDGFTLDTLSEAVDFAHAYGVGVLLAVNILFTAEEMPQVVDLVVRAYHMGVDAFIVQDLGLAAILHREAPEIVLHASTQMGLHNWEGVQAVLPFGFRRVVLARETPLAEVRRIRMATDIEIEYFVQGALCVCFSGNCYLSERMMGAGGNRGRCKQPCRLPYTLRRNGVDIRTGYLLSAKDFNMIDRLDRLAAAGVDVLKIEGRARRASYVAMTTAEYRRALDGQTPDLDALSLAYNRQFTAGYLDGIGAIISPYNNHIGIAVGRVTRVVLGKRFNEVYIASDRAIAPRSVLKFYRGTVECATLSAYDLNSDAQGEYRLTTTQEVPAGAEVRLIADAAAEASALSRHTRRKIAVNVSLKVGAPMTATVQLPNRTLYVQGALCQPAQNQPLTRAQLLDNFDRHDLFEAVLSVSALERAFVPKSALNAWRRAVFDAVYKGLTAPYRRNLAPISPHVPSHVVSVACAEWRDGAPWPDADVVVYNPDDVAIAKVRDFVLRCRRVGARPYLDVPDFALAADFDLLRGIVSATSVGVVAHNYGALHLTPDTLVGAGLNVYNPWTAEALGYPVAETGVPYPYMTLRHCPMQSHVGGDCAHCRYADGYEYVMDDGRVLHLRRRRMTDCTFYLE